MKAISVRAPWWWAILHCGKDIENRNWPTNYRGRILLHASKWWNTEEFFDDMESVSDCYRTAGNSPRDFGTTPRQIKELGGHIVGSVEIVDCVTSSESPWFFGNYGFVLRNPIALEYPYLEKGALGLFESPSRRDAQSSIQQLSLVLPEVSS